MRMCVFWQGTGDNLKGRFFNMEKKSKNSEQIVNQQERAKGFM